MSDSDTDTSIEPEEVALEVVEEKKPKKNVKIKKDNEVIHTREEGLKKPKAPYREYTLKEIMEMEKELENDKLDREPEPEPEPAPVKRGRGQPKLTEQQKLERKLSKKTIVKEKTIYMIPDDKGGFKKVKNPVLSDVALRRLKRQEEKEKEEVKLGKALVAKKNGGIDKRSNATRTPAQQASLQRMLEANKKRREAQKDLKKEQTKNVIKESVREVVHEPFYQPKIAPPAPAPPKWNELISNM